MDYYVPRKEVLKVLNIHYNTLYNMIDRKEIDVIEIGGKNFYNLNKFLKVKGIETNKKKICYDLYREIFFKTL